MNRYRELCSRYLTGDNESTPAHQHQPAHGRPGGSKSPKLHHHEHYLSVPEPGAWFHCVPRKSAPPSMVNFGHFSTWEQEQIVLLAKRRLASYGGDHGASRWGAEGLPLTSDASLGPPLTLGPLDRDQITDIDGQTLEGSDDLDDIDESEPKTVVGKVRKFIKILIPHVILISMLLGYLSVGAGILTWLESTTELNRATDKVGRLLQKYIIIANETWDIRDSPEITHREWTEIIRKHLLEVGELHEGPRYLVWVDEYPAVQSRWTFPTALLYALTVLTTCGYGEVGVYTPVGQLFAVAFALVGIPLMFITAADIGKFLSESLMKIIDFLKMAAQRIRRLLRGKRKPGQLAQEKDDEFLEFGAPDTMQKLWFPVLTYVSVISAYCCLGAVLFRTWQPEWAFIHAFHFGFNLIVTVGLGELVVTDPLFLCLIVAFVIIGLSVVTMCVDLASTHLKAYFAQLHYFGRAKKFLDMGEDIRNMMEYLAWIRKKKGGTVTWQDVKDLMETIKLGPYAPRDAARAFYKVWDAARMRWIDETSSAVSTVRHNSCGSEHTLPCHLRHFPSQAHYSRHNDRKHPLQSHTSASHAATPFTPDADLALRQNLTLIPQNHNQSWNQANHREKQPRPPSVVPATPSGSAPSLGEPSNLGEGGEQGTNVGGSGVPRGVTRLPVGYRRVPTGWTEDQPS